MDSSAVVQVLNQPAALVQVSGPTKATVLATDLAIAVVTVAEQGPPGPPGRSGTGSGSNFFDYTQTVPAAVWTITHNLSTYPSVTAADSAGSVVCGAVTYPSASVAVLTFSSAFAGTAHLV